MLLVLGYFLWAAALVSYFLLLRAISCMVSEARSTGSHGRFSWFWWIPAWKLHRGVYPTSHLRDRIVQLYVLTFLLMTAGMVA